MIVRCMHIAFLSALLVSLVAGSVPALRARDAEVAYRLDSTLRMLQILREDGDTSPLLLPLVASEKVHVTVRFQRGFGLESASMLGLEKELGVEFDQRDGRAVGWGRIRSARVPWNAIESLASWPGVERVSSVWKPAVAAPLDVSLRAIGADAVWSLLDEAGRPVAGQGIVIANFDTGIDVYHPDFWRADGGSYAWLDVNGNGLFDPGTDGVDLNGNGLYSAGELLRVLHSTSLPVEAIPGTNDPAFTPDTDWLYNDANGNGVRDFGPTRGFTETAATYGERIFLLQDNNRNGTVDTGERLLALGTSKVQRILGPNGSEYRYGVNMIVAPRDDQGHGTQVASILAGGAVGLRRYVGVAPDSTLLVADCWHNDFTVYVPWAAANGAQVMLYEFGSWVQEFLDGSSDLEKMLDEMSARGIVQVAPAGNLADGAKHAHLLLSAVSPRQVRFVVPIGDPVSETWLSILWRHPLGTLQVQLTTPAGTTVPLPGDGSISRPDGHTVVSLHDRSERGTSRLDIRIRREGASLTSGVWTLTLRSSLTTAPLNINAYAWDPEHDWVGGVSFLDAVDGFYTVTSPATADSAIAVASYSTRGRVGDPLGILSPFSGQGPRIDGEPVLDVAAPGHYADIACARSKDVSGGAFGQYAWFGGTSAAAAHAAGAVALIRQVHPYLDPVGVTRWLQFGARQDAQTGVDRPNDRWGYGKLDAAAAVAAIPTPTPTPRARIFLPAIVRGVSGS